MHVSLKFSDMPICCKNCIYRDYDSKDEYSEYYNYCVIGLWLPTKKLTCKKQKIEHVE